MSAGYASRLKEYPNKGVCGLPEHKDTTRSYQVKRKRLLELVRQASGSIVILTGAGISTAAGIPDFRGPKGIWTAEQQNQKNNKQKKKSPLKKRPRDEGTTAAAAAATSAAVVSMDFGTAQPTLTHGAIRHLIHESQLVSFCVTQNVDGLHVRSGISRNQLAVLHGCVFTEKCETCATEHFRNTDVGGMSFRRTGRLCDKCQAPLRDTLLDWKDPLPEDDYQRAVDYCQRAKLVICLGTSLRIEPAGSLPTLGRQFVIVNLQETPYDSQACLIVRAKVDTVMRDLMHDLGYSNEDEWNVPATNIERHWKNPAADEEYVSSWWQIDSEDDNDDDDEVSATKDSDDPPVKVSSSEEEDSDEKASETASISVVVGGEKRISKRAKNTKSQEPAPPQKTNKPDGTIYLQRRVAKQFKGVWYMGTVANYNPKTGFWWIEYDDGDEEEMKHPELQKAMKAHEQQQQQS